MPRPRWWRVQALPRPRPRPAECFHAALVQYPRLERESLELLGIVGRRLHADSIGRYGFGGPRSTLEPCSVPEAPSTGNERSPPQPSARGTGAPEPAVPVGFGTCLLSSYFSPNPQPGGSRRSPGTASMGRTRGNGRGGHDPTGTPAIRPLGRGVATPYKHWAPWPLAVPGGRTKLDVEGIVDMTGASQGQRRTVVQATSGRTVHGLTHRGVLTP